MGIFGWIADKVASAVEWVGEKARAVSNWFNGVEEKAKETSSNIGRSESYDDDDATLEQTININNELNAFKNVASKEAKKIEDMLVDECESVLDKLIDSINEINDKANLNIPLTNLRRDSKKLLKSIKGSIENDVITKISIDNATCKAILYLDAGDNKERQMKDFISNTSRNAIKKMQETLNDRLQDNIDSIKDKIEMHLGNAESLHQRDAKVLNEMKNSKDGKEKEKLQINIAYDMFDYANALDFVRHPLSRKVGANEDLSYAFSKM